MRHAKGFSQLNGTAVNRKMSRGKMSIMIRLTKGVTMIASDMSRQRQMCR